LDLVPVRQMVTVADITLYYMVHVDNIASIQTYGILPRNRAMKLEHLGRDIADADVIHRRGLKRPFGRSLHDYVPLYFNPKNPMLSRRRAIQDEIVILCINGKVINEDGVRFTDGNAAASASRYFSRSSDLSKINWECIRAEYWSEFPDGGRIRCAEVLVPRPVEFSEIEKIIVRSNETKHRVSNLISLVDKEASIQPRWYI